MASIDPATLLAQDAAFKAAYDSVARLKLAFIASTAVLVWDWLALLPDERRHVWPRRRTLVGATALVNRYFVLLVHGSICGLALFGSFTQAQCERIFMLHPYACLLSFFPSSLLFIIRACALWDYQRWLVAVFALLLIAGQAAALAIPAQFSAIPVIEGLTGCQGGLLDSRDYTWLLFFPTCLIEVLSTIAILAKYFQARRHYRSAGTALLARLAADALFYASTVMVLSLANMLMWSFYDDLSDRAILTYPTVTLASVMSARLVLSLHRDSAGGSLSTASHGTISGRVKAFLRGTSSSGGGGSKASASTSLPRSAPSSASASRGLTASVDMPSAPSPRLPPSIALPAFGRTKSDAASERDLELSPVDEKFVDARSEV